MRPVLPLLIGWLRPLISGISLLSWNLQSSPGAELDLAHSLPSGLVCRSGDQSVLLHWAPITSARPSYHVFRRTTGAASFQRLTDTPILTLTYADLTVQNEQSYEFTVRTLSAKEDENARSDTVRATPRAFRDDAEFLEYLQQAAFDYFWFEANPANGLVRDRSRPDSLCSIAAVGFGLSALTIGIDHGWITRNAGAARALATVRTFWELPQGPAAEGTIGHNGWFYHFLDMKSGLRAARSELSSIDTALLLAGVLHARQFFDAKNPVEEKIRWLAEAIFSRVDWTWMMNGEDSLTHGWRPETGFIRHRWIGYNEAMILYLLGLGASRAPLPPPCWERWVQGYKWETHYEQTFVSFPPLFGHHYSHCWIDFRDQADAFMRNKGLTYFENSRRATLAQRAYCVANRGGFYGYGANVWGLTACDGPGAPPYADYGARGAPPSLSDDGTIAPAAAGGSLPFAPEVALPALRFMYDQFRPRIWTGYGFRDAFNLTANWWDPDVLGIDQGPILLMAENFRFGRVWDRFMQNPEVQRGLKAAGFRRLHNTSSRQTDNVYHPSSTPSVTFDSQTNKTRPQHE